MTHHRDTRLCHNPLCIKYAIPTEIANGHGYCSTECREDTIRRETKQEYRDGIENQKRK